MTILELLEAHTVKRPWSEASRMRCKCGEVVIAETEGQLYALHRAHVAEVLEARQQEAKAEALEDASKDLTHPMHGIIVCDEYCANRSCPDCIRIRAAKDAAEWLNQRAGKFREGL